MNVCAIIAEYNPFHYGHKEQIDFVRKNYPDTVVVSIMSGNMVQRGEAAVLDKYKRADAAVHCGADLVLELPYPYCCSSAGYFASSAVSIVHRIGADMLCFGSECGDISLLKQVAKRTLSKEYTEYLESLTKEGKNTSLSYISAYRKAYKDLYSEDMPEGANNTLAIEYLKAIESLGSAIIPITNKRTSPYSASASRYYYRNDEKALSSALPEEMYQMLCTKKPVNTESLAAIILWHFRNAKAEDLCQYADVDTGLASRLISCACDSLCLEDFYAQAATKKYTDSRVRRAVFNCLLGVKKEMLENKPEFSTLLCANSVGCKFLKEVRKTKNIPIITKPADYKKFGGAIEEAFLFSNRADTLYSCISGEKSSDILRKTPIIL